MEKQIDLTGKLFGRWLVIEHAPRPENCKYRGNWWLCKCQCGIIRPVMGNSLVSKKSRSCGCLRTDVIRAILPRLKHGQCKRGQRTKEWRAWHAMIRRCRYPSMQDYPRYGGRGIKVCQEWQDSFEKFFAYIGLAPSPKHTLDRIDNDGDYKPGNVRWATAREQQKNSRHARLLTLKGRTQTIVEWSEETGINRQTIQMRIDHYGWPIKKALTEKVRLPLVHPS